MKTYKMLPCQNNIYKVAKKYPSSGICNLGGLLCFPCDKDAGILKNACEHILKTNSNFWIKISSNAEIYFDEIIKYEFEQYDFTAKDRAYLEEKYQQWMDEPLFEHDTYLFDIKYVICNEYKALFVKAHHIIADGFSVALFAGKIEEIYDKMKNGDELPTLDCSYLEKIEAGSDDYEMKASYSIFCKTTSNPKASYITKSISGVQDYLRKNHLTFEALFYTAFALYLNNAYSCKEIKVLRNLVNRSGKDYKSIGMYVLTSAFDYSMDADSDICLKDYMQSLRKSMAAHASGHMTEETAADVIISYRPDKLMEKLSKGKCIEIVSSFSELPLKILIMEKAGEVLIRYIYQEEAFSHSYIENMSRVINNIITCITCGDYEKISEIPVLAKEDKEKYEKLNDTKESACEESLLKRFAENVKKFPGKIALVEDRDYSYSEVWQLVTLAAKYIDDNLIEDRARIICISLARSKWHPVFLYASWLSGCSYMPVNPKNSYEHNRRIYEKCALVIDEKCICELEQSVKCHKEDNNDYSLPEVAGTAYYMFTSGTTKEPKAVEICHTSLNERITWMAEEFEGKSERILHKTNNSFDVSMWEISLAWAFAKTLYIAKEGAEKNPSDIIDYIKRYNITMLHFVPSMFKHFLDCIEKNKCRLPSLKCIILSGERLDATSVRRAKHLLENVILYNLYGPTECTIDVTYYRCRGDEEEVPIGKPVSGTKIYIYNDFNKMVVPGERGQLVVSGKLVGKYSNIFAKEENDGFAVSENERLYYTKDIAHLADDGLIYYDGREDSQIKIRGMRVDVNALENAVNSAFMNCLAIIIHDNSKLICVYEGNEEKEKISEYIRNNFPYYYMPSAVIRIDSIPVNSNGKADRKKTADIISSFDTAKINMEDEIWEIERIKNVLADTAAKYIPGGIISERDNLYDMGMDSISALSYLADLENCGIVVNYSNFATAYNIHELAACIYHERAATSEDIVYFSNRGEKELIVSIPFAAGTPLSFYNLFKECDTKKYDFAVAVTDKAIDRISESAYERVHIISSCVGSSRALMLCKELKERAASLTLCESIPYRGLNIAGKIFTIWDICPDAFISVFLCKIRGKKFKSSGEMIKKFRQDVRESAKALRKVGRFGPECPVMCIYGENDRLTKGYKKKYRRWNRYLDADIKLRSIAAANHFLVEDKANEVYNLFDNE